jgi:hypothetical protein
MGKSFNNDVFKSGFNINGIGITSEAIEENKKALNLDQDKDIKEVSSEEELKEAVKDYIKEDILNNKNVSDEENDKINTLIKGLYKDAIKDMENKDEEISLEDKLNEAKERVKTIKEEQQAFNSKSDKDTTIYTKKTMIFKQEYLDIIDGLASLNDMQIKDVLNQVLEQGISVLEKKDANIIDKAIKEANKQKKSKYKEEKNLF